MDNRGKRQASSIFGGMGFYIALLVCVLAAGVVGYFALLNNNTVSPDPDPDPIPASDPTPSLDQLPSSSQSVSSNEDEPASPVMSEEPVTIPVKPVTNPAQSSNAAGPAPSAAPAAATEPEAPLSVVAPLNGETVAVFSVDQLTYDTTLGDWRTHDGIDIQAAAGTEVVAACAGTIHSVENDGRLGTTIVIDHPDGTSTTYASLQTEVSVLAGDRVAAGDVIGAVGNTSLSEAGLGAHLHFGVTKDGQSIDPAAYLAGAEN